MVSRAAFVSLLGLLPAAAAVPAGSSPTAEEARWLVHEADWGYLSAINRGPAAGTPASTASTKMKPSGEVASFSDGATGASTGRLFFYVMTGDPKTEGASSIGASDTSFLAALTFSEAIMDPADYSASQCGARKAVDPEDPRCAKITLTGMMQPSAGGDVDIGKAALFARHPQMKDWPTDHGFKVFEMNITDIWMIANYGGGSTVPVSDYFAAKPKHHPAADDAHSLAMQPTISTPPPWNHTAARARWLVYNSLWTAVSTISAGSSSYRQVPAGSPWGNVRDVADGVGANSSGLPYLYLPTPDPTAVDLAADSHATISLSEAAIGARVVNGTAICGGMDAEDPTCGRIHLNGRLLVIKNASIPDAEVALGARHPNAPWLATVRLKIIGDEILKNVGKSESCMVTGRRAHRRGVLSDAA